MAAAAVKRTLLGGFVMSVSDPKTEAPLALRPREAAKALGMSKGTLAKWTQQGIIPHVRRGKTILYPVDVLRRWLDEQAKTEGGKK
jgi:excisionase family DNA binding protein